MDDGYKLRIREAAVLVGLFVCSATYGERGEAEECTHPEPPVTVAPANNAFLISMPDGTVQMLFARAAAGGGLEIAWKRTADAGRSWSEPVPLMKLPGTNWSTPLPLLARDGELHFFWMIGRGAGGKPAVDFFIDIWHARSSEGRTKWSSPRRIWEGYVGSINGMAQLRSGRIVVPFAYWVGGVPEAPPTGPNITTTIYSDDNGQTWKQSTAKLTAPCYKNYNGANYGACEPTIIELKDGRVWMLIRTQTGVLYESFSPDGVAWSQARPTRFCSSDSPACLTRLPDGRIALFWNNCENTSRINGQGVYTNRDALHAALSEDEGKSWRGYREICRDPMRNEPPPKRGDRGTSYPYATAAKDGTLLVVTGQGQGRRNILRIDPTWLCETHAGDDFSKGLDGWSVFKAFGPAAGWWRNRTSGARLIDAPDMPGAKVLHIRRPDEKDGDGAVWNFPIGRRGKLCVWLLLQQCFVGGSIALADRFIQPTDDIGEKKVLATLPITVGGQLPGGAKLEPGRWHTLELRWDMDKAACEFIVDGRLAGSLVLSRNPSPGVCYVRFRSTATSVDPAGFLIKSIAADVGKASSAGSVMNEASRNRADHVIVNDGGPGRFAAWPDVLRMPDATLICLTDDGISLIPLSEWK
jgi:hypothetical protein